MADFGEGTKAQRHEGAWFGMLVVIITIIRTNGKYKKSQEGDGISGFERANQASNRPQIGHISTVSLVRVGISLPETNIRHSLITQ